MLVLCFNIFNHTGDGSSGCGSYIGAHAAFAARTLETHARKVSYTAMSTRTGWLTQPFLQPGHPAAHGRLSLPALRQHFFQCCCYVQALESREDRFKATLLKRWVYNPIAN